MIKKLLSGVALLLAFNVFAAEEKSLYGEIPDGAWYSVRANMEKIANLPLCTETPEIVELKEKFRNKFKINLSDLQEITFICGTENQSEYQILIIRCNVDKETVLESLKNNNFDIQVKQIDGRKIYSSKKFPRGLSFYFPEPGLLIVCRSHTDIEQYLEAVKNGVEKTVFRRTPNDDTLVEFCVKPALRISLKPGNTQPSAGTEFLHAKLTSSGKDNRDLLFNSKIEYDNADTAKQSVMTLKNYVTLINEKLSRSNPDLGEKIIESVKIETKDKSVTVKIHLPEAVVEEIKNAILETSNTRNKSGNQPEESNLNKHQKAAAAPAA